MVEFDLEPGYCGSVIATDKRIDIHGTPQHFNGIGLVVLVIAQSFQDSPGTSAKDPNQSLQNFTFESQRCTNFLFLPHY